MNKGIQVWAVTFGAIVMFITFAIIIIRTSLAAVNEKIQKKSDKKIMIQKMHSLNFKKIKWINNKSRKEITKIEKDI